MDWDSVDLSALSDFIRERSAGQDAEKMIWSFEHALAAARVDPHLLDYLLAAAVCLVAHADRETPRTVLEQVFRRSVADDEGHHRYAPLLAEGRIALAPISLIKQPRQPPDPHAPRAFAHGACVVALNASPPPHLPQSLQCKLAHAGA